MKGYGYTPYFVEGSEPEAMHQMMAETLDTVIAEIKRIQEERPGATADAARPRWPMIVLRSPKGWTGPKEVDGVPIEGTWRSHQVPLADFGEEARARQAARRMDEELQAGGALRRERHADSRVARAGAARATAGWGPIRTPTAACCSRSCGCRTSGTTPWMCPGRARSHAEPTRVLGYFLRDVMKMNLDRRNFRVFGPDETASNRLDAIYEVTDKVWEGRIEPVDEHLSRERARDGDPQRAHLRGLA